MDDEGTIRKIIKDQETHWNAGNARRYCLRFGQDVTLTNMLGAVYTGHEAVEAHLDEMLSTVFKKTRISMKIRSIRSVREDVVLVDIDTELSRFASLPPGVNASADGKLRTRLLEVIVKERFDWGVFALYEVDVKIQ
jgi:uncharacterized protein (TIGR02246 family)